MLREEFERLVALFEAAASGKSVQLNQVFAQALEFFNHLKVQIEKGNADDKREAMEMMAELHKHMTAETKKICERSGFSEEQLVSYAEDSKNFSPDQWRAIQESKEKIAQAGHNLAKAIYEHGKEGLPPPKTETKKVPSKKSKKSDWLRS